MKEHESYIGEVVFRYKIQTPFAVGAVYSYLLKDEKVVLVDCGQHEERAYEKVQHALKQQGLNIEDLDEIWLNRTGILIILGRRRCLRKSRVLTVYGHPGAGAIFQEITIASCLLII
ncbi:MAG: hypothetical protein U5K69_29855 [Balneolaceae bacterium]|nr:hypothetical protein [Balneolaceae bacterium]